MSTGTQTTTYTIADIRKVLDNFAADFFMMAQATGLRSAENVRATVSDLKAFAEAAYLVEVKIFLLDKDGNKLRAAVYKVSESAAGWQTSRPGDNLWPRISDGALWIVATLNDNWWGKQDAGKEAFKKDRGLNGSWGITDKDATVTGLASSAGQRYESNGYGLARTNYTRG